jgi:hypothetical protein
VDVGGVGGWVGGGSLTQSRTLNKHMGMGNGDTRVRDSCSVCAPRAQNKKIITTDTTIAHDKAVRIRHL